MDARDVTAADSAATKHAYALETNRMANDLYELIFPPWRWLAWRRSYREIKRRMRVLAKARGVE